jgi:hypothetical protein
MSLWGFWRKKLSTFTCIFYQLSAFHFCAMCVYIKINKIIFSTHKIWVNCSCIKLHRDHIWISHKLAFLIYFVIFPNLKFKYLQRFLKITNQTYFMIENLKNMVLTLEMFCVKCTFSSCLYCIRGIDLSKPLSMNYKKWINGWKIVTTKDVNSRFCFGLSSIS